MRLPGSNTSVFFAIAVLLALAAGVTNVSAKAMTARDVAELNARAMQFAEANDPKTALPLFRAAAKALPTNGEYWNNLGVCYMRLQRWNRAIKALKRGVDANNADAARNLKEVEAYAKAIKLSPNVDAEDEDEPEAAPAAAAPESSSAASPSASSSAAKPTPDGRAAPRFLPKPVYVKPAGLNVRPRRKVPRLTLAELYAPGNEKFADGKAPYIITGAMDDWPATSKWDLNYFKNRFGASIVDFYPHNMAKHDTHPYLTRMDEALTELESPSGRYPHDPYSPGTYLQWNVNPPDWDEMLADTRLPYAFRRDEEWLETRLTPEMRAEYTKKVHWRMVLIGSRGAGMFVHIDVLQSASWQAQVSGAKRWFLCAPDQSQYLYGAGKVDVFNPDYATYPLFAQSDCYEDVVRGGEMVYYPANYWHQTENQGALNVAFSSTISDDNNYQLVMHELKAECATQKFKWQFSRELCTALESVFTFWRDRYDTTLDRGKCKLTDPH